MRNREKAREIKKTLNSIMYMYVCIYVLYMQVCMHVWMYLKIQINIYNWNAYLNVEQK